MAENATSTFTLNDNISSIVNVYNNRIHSSLVDNKGKRGYSPSHYINNGIIPPPKYIMRGQIDNPVANLKSGFHFKENKDAVDKLMKQAYRKFPLLTMVKLSTTKGQFLKNSSNEDYTRENYLVTSIKRPYLSTEPVTFKVSSQNGIELK